MTRRPTLPRRRSRRAVAASACGTALAVLLAACGSTKVATTKKTAQQATARPETLKIITWVNPPAVKAFQTIDAEFHKKYPNITVQLRTAANVNGPYKTLLETTVDAHSADIVTNVTPFQPLPPHPTRANMTSLQYWATHGVFASLNGQSWLKDFKSSALAPETYKGQVYGLVSGDYQEGVFYNKAIFARYHLNPPTTYDQFVSVLRTLAAHKVTPLFVGLGDVGPVYLQFLYYTLMGTIWYPHIASGNLAQALETGATKWTSPYFTKVLEREETIAKYLEPNFTGVPWESMPGDFAKGDAAMLLDGSWDMPSVQAANPNIKVGFFPLPGSNVAANNKSYISSNLSFEVLNDAPDKAAAMKWLAFFSTPKIYEQYVNMTGISPSRKSGVYHSFTASVLGKYFGTGVHGSLIFPVLASTDAYWDQPANWPTLQLDVIQGSKSPSAVEALYEQDWKVS
jgi:raffinose/stachyose/melibiose transport system substrate-binding protein